MDAISDLATVEPLADEQPIAPSHCEWCDKEKVMPVTEEQLTNFVAVADISAIEVR